MAESDSKYEIISRKEAKAKGLKFYCTGKPCSRGHIALRRLPGSQCTECVRIINAKWSKLNKHKVRESRRKWNAANPEKVKQKYKRLYEKHQEKRRQKRREYYARNREKEIARSLDYQRRNADAVTAKQRMYRKQYYQKHREKLKRDSNEWYHNNKERARATQVVSAKRWWKKNPGKRRIYNHNRRFKYGTGKAGYSVADIDDIFNMQRGKCGYCRTALVKGKFHVDHIIPVSKGGSNLRSNLQILCRKCNQTKSFLDPIVYAQSIGLLL